MSRSVKPDDAAALAELHGCADWRGEDSSLKFCRVAEGACDVYPRTGPTSEWDTAAGQAVLEAAGGRVLGPDGEPLAYGKPGFMNGAFTAYGA
jgi:3'(2'), 5'-bisphosphate nucleotidase